MLQVYLFFMLQWEILKVNAEILQFFGISKAVFTDGRYADCGNHLLVRIPSPKELVHGHSTGSGLIAITMAGHFLCGFQRESASCFQDVVAKCFLLLQMRDKESSKCVAR
jgi:hypothetical protein